MIQLILREEETLRCGKCGDFILKPECAYVGMREDGESEVLCKNCVPNEVKKSD